jgi:XTP/dITP diphosphohydrolase
MRLLLATHNPGKLLEMQALLDGLNIELVSPASLGLALDVVEDGMTYAENAGLKAVAYARASHLAALADDSGLEVDALGGRPGIHSARYSAAPGANDADRRRLLLRNLNGFPLPWTACFRCSVAIATPAGELHLTEGVCHGEIIPNERGQFGFGYDPIFLLPGLGKTMAELSMPVKNTLSHRAQAVISARPYLAALL